MLAAASENSKEEKSKGRFFSALHRYFADM